VCGPLGGGGSSMAVVVASICNECKHCGGEVGREFTGSFLGKSSG
jgi:hypothetical protein